MSCYNRQYTGMPDYSCCGGSMGMPAWQGQGWQDNGSGNAGSEMGMGMQDWMNRYPQMGNPQMGDPQMGNPQMGNPPMGNPPATIQPDHSFCPDSGNYPLAMSYVPMQRWSQPLPIEKAITRGTIFKELDLPFEMGGCR